MSKIRIKNFGPIKDGFDTEDGFMDIKKVTVFIGDQGTGKSTVAKLISTFMWVEKTLYRASILDTPAEQFVKDFWGYQGIENYFSEKTEIEYKGEVCSFLFRDMQLLIPNINLNLDGRVKYLVPKIMYVPAERNFLSVVTDADKIKNLPKPLYTFLDEFENAQQDLVEELILPVSKFKFNYNKPSRTAHISGDGYKINLLEASSGLQSMVPLFLVSRNLAISIGKKGDSSKNEISLNESELLRQSLINILGDTSLSPELKNEAIKLLSSKYVNSCFVNIVEEPEQNLFPTSQRHMLNSLVGFANMTEGNKLIMTTHSPYIISYLGIAVQGHNLLEKINASSKPDGLKERVEQVVPEKSVIAPEDLVIYQLQENGTISRLADYEGIPADKNFLNQSLVESNQLFGRLLEIEEDL